MGFVHGGLNTMRRDATLQPARGKKPEISVTGRGEYPSHEDRHARVEGRRCKSTVLAERKRVEQQAAKECKELIQRHFMMYLSAAVDKLDAPSGDLRTSLKRQISEVETAALMETTKRQKKAWSQLVALQEKAHKKPTDSCEEYGSIEPPIDPELWLELAETDNAGFPMSQNQQWKGMQKRNLQQGSN